jgi:3-hydroxyisobutyrate dehydrogenase-like beta-hydroxyacid dehydrogenase
MKIGIIGYGEVGKIFALGLAPKTGQTISAWDIKFTGGTLGSSEIEHAKQHGITTAHSAQSLCAQSELIFSAVTAANTLSVAREVSEHIKSNCFFIDLNSASPRVKQEASALIDAAGGRYVEAGVMTSVPPYGIRVPMLLGGEYAAELAAVLVNWGMDATPVSNKIGIASATKMSRSIMIKGLEALVIESFTTARYYGVEQAMLATLAETFPSIDWPTQGAYFFSRVAQHGKRRAEEMREAAKTVSDTGHMPFMTQSIPEKHDWMANLAKAGLFEGLDKNSPWTQYADRILRQPKKDYT